MSNFLSKQKFIPLPSLKTDNILIGNYGCKATIEDYKEVLKQCICENMNIERQMVCRETLKDFVSNGLGVTFTGAPQTFKYKRESPKNSNQRSSVKNNFWSGNYQNDN